MVKLAVGNGWMVTVCSMVSRQVPVKAMSRTGKSPAVLNVKFALAPVDCEALLNVHWNDDGLPMLVLWKVAGCPMQALVKLKEASGVATMLMVFSALAEQPLLADTDKLT